MRNTFRIERLALIAAGSPPALVGEMACSRFALQAFLPRQSRVKNT